MMSAAAGRPGIFKFPVDARPRCMLYYCGYISGEVRMKVRFHIVYAYDLYSCPLVRSLLSLRIRKAE